MNKAIAAIGGITTIGVATSVPTMLLTGNSTPGQEEEIIRELQWESSMPNLKVAKDIEKSYREIDCVKDNFKETADWNSAREEKNNLVSALNFNSNGMNGCLIVDYYKQKYKEDKWQGEFKLVLSMTGTQEKERGIMAVVHAKTKDEKLSVDSTFYVLEKKNSKWIVNYNANTTKEVSQDSELTNLIPQNGTLITEPSTSQKYWGFDPQLGNICKEKGCRNKEGEPTKFSETWKITNNASDETEKSVDSLFTNFYNWFTSNFDTNCSLYVQMTSSLRKLNLTKQNKVS